MSTRIAPLRAPIRSLVAFVGILASTFALPAQAPPHAADPPPAEAVAEEAAPSAATAADDRTEAVPDTIETPAVEPDGRIARGDRFLMAGTLLVPKGETRIGDVVSIGGKVVVEGRVRGSVVVIAGDTVVEGTVDRDVVTVLGDVRLGPDARVDWSLINVLGRVNDEGGSVGRDFVQVPLALSWPGVGGPLRVLVTIWLWVKSVIIVLVFLGILVLTALAPERVERLAAETDRRAGVALLLGAPAFVIGLPLVVLALVASLVGLLALPVVLLGFAFFVWLGYAGIFRHVGRRIGRAFGRDLSLVASVLLGFLLFALVWFVPLLGAIVWTGLTWLATGLMITGRLGGAGSPAAGPPPPSPIPPSPEPVAPEVS